MAYFDGEYTFIPRDNGIGTKINIKAQNFVNTPTSSRGIVAVALPLDFGTNDELLYVTVEEYARNAKGIFGYEIGHPKLKYIDELFKGATELIIYRINNGGEKAAFDFGTARYSGIRGNDLEVSVEADPDAGTTKHFLADTQVEFTAEGDSVTAKFLNIPYGYVPSLIVDGAVNTVTTEKGNAITVTFAKDTQTEVYTVSAGISNDAEYYPLSVATVNVEHTDPTEQKFLSIEGTEVKASNLGEEYQTIGLEYIPEGNSLTIKYSNMPESSKVSYQLYAGSQRIQSSTDTITIVENSDNYVLRFTDAVDATPTYTFKPRIVKDGATTLLANYNFNIEVDGETKDEYVTVTVGEQEDTEYTETYPARFIVKTYLDQTLVDSQKVPSMANLRDNDYIVWDKSVPLEETAGMILEGGENGEITVGAYGNALNAFENQFFHVLACPCDDEAIKMMYANFTKRMRAEMGMKFQCVMPPTVEPMNHIGIIQPVNRVQDDENPRAIIYWTAGREAGAEVNESVANFDYDGAFKLETGFTQGEILDLCDSGYLVFHEVRGADRKLHVRTHTDINTLVEPSKDQTPEFNRNQTIRVLDETCIYIARLFNNNYAGKFNNRKARREQLANDIRQYLETLESIEAIDEFDPNSVVVEEGPTKRIVIVRFAIRPVNAMEQLYGDITVLL